MMSPVGSSVLEGEEGEGLDSSVVVSFGSGAFSSAFAD